MRPSFEATSPNGSKIPAPAVHENRRKPRIGIALQGGGLFCAFHQGVMEVLAESDIAPHIVAMTGTSGGAVQEVLYKDACLDGDPRHITQKGRAFWGDVLNERRQAFTFLGMSMMTVDFTRAVLTGTVPHTPTDTLHDVLKRHVRHPHELGTPGPNLYCGAVKYNHQGTAEHHVFGRETMGIDAAICSSALRRLGAHNGFYDEAYMFNPFLGKVLEEDITDLIILTTSPYDPTLPVAPQAEQRQRHRRPGRELMLSEIHGEALWLREQQSDVKIHGIHLNWDPKWTLADKLIASNDQVCEILRREITNASAATPCIMSNLGKNSTYDPKIAESTSRPQLVVA